MTENNVFEFLANLGHSWRQAREQELTALCTTDKEGHFSARLQRPVQLATVLVMSIAALYLLYWLVSASHTLRLWPTGVFLILSVAVLCAGVILLLTKYTLTHDALVIRGLSSRTIPLDTLKSWGTAKPPEIRAMGSIRFHLEGTDTVALSLLGLTAGGIHFVMLLAQASGLDLVEEYIGVEQQALHTDEHESLSQ